MAPRMNCASPPRGPAGPVLAVPGHHIHMRPGGAGLDEAFQEQRRGHRTGERPVGHIVHVRDIAGEQFSVGLEKRHPPDRILLRLAGLQQRGGRSVVIAEERRQVGPERGPGGAGQCRAVEDQVRRFAGGFRERVAQDEAAFGVGVADLDRQPLASADHVHGPHGIAGNAVLDRRDHQPEPHGQRRRHHHMGKPDHVGRTAHILLHQPHAGRRLQVQPAAVETDALADQGEFGPVFASPDEVDQPRRNGGSAADGMDGRVVPRQQVVTDDGRDLRSVALAEFPDSGFEPFRPHIVGRRVDEVANLRLRLDGCERRAPVRVCRPDEAGAVPALAVRIGVEGVAAEPPGDGGPA